MRGEGSGAVNVERCTFINARGLSANGVVMTYTVGFSLTLTSGSAGTANITRCSFTNFSDAVNGLVFSGCNYNLFLNHTSFFRLRHFSRGLILLHSTTPYTATLHLHVLSSSFSTVFTFSPHSIPASVPTPPATTPDPSSSLTSPSAFYLPDNGVMSPRFVHVSFERFFRVKLTNGAWGSSSGSDGEGGGGGGAEPGGIGGEEIYEDSIILTTHAATLLLLNCSFRLFSLQSGCTSTNAGVASPSYCASTASSLTDLLAVLLLPLPSDALGVTPPPFVGQPALLPEVLGEEGLVVTDVEAVCGVCAVAMLTGGGGVAGFMQPVVEIQSTVFTDMSAALWNPYVNDSVCACFRDSLFDGFYALPGINDLDGTINPRVGRSIYTKSALLLVSSVFRNCRNAVANGSVINQENALTGILCSFVNCSSSQHGGAISVSTTACTLRQVFLHCIFQACACFISCFFCLLFFFTFFFLFFLFLYCTFPLPTRSLSQPRTAQIRYDIAAFRPQCCTTTSHIASATPL